MARNPTAGRAGAAIPLILLLGTLFSPGARGQSEAEIAIRDARVALEAEDWARARDLLKKAAETEPDNPDVHLLLGRAHYQLVELEEAMAAWRTTLRLAPGQSEAAAKLAALEARLADAATQLQLAERLLDRQMIDPAETVLRRLRTMALDPSQRHQLDFLMARHLFLGGHGLECVASLEALRLVDPGRAQGAEFQLLRARALLRVGGAHEAEALQSLRELRDAGQAAAGLELILREVHGQRAGAAALRAWLDETPAADDFARARALASLIHASLRESWSEEPAEADALPAADITALDALAELLALSAESREPLLDRIQAHLQQRHVQQGRPARAVAAILRLSSAREDLRLRLLPTLVPLQMQIARTELLERLATDAIPTEPPASLSAVRDSLRRWRGLEARGAASQSQIELAGMLAGIEDPETSAGFPPHRWAVELYVEMLDSATPQRDLARQGLAQLIQRSSLRPSLAARRQAADWQRILVQRAHDRASRAAAGLQLAQIGLLAEQLAHAEAGALPEALGEDGRGALEALIEVARDWPPSADAALVTAGQLASPWTQAGRREVADGIYATLEQALPEAQRRRARLARLDSVLRASREQDLATAAAGKAPARALKEEVIAALRELEQLRGTLDEDDPLTAAATALRERMVVHYLHHDRTDLARAVLDVAATPPVPASRIEARLRRLALDDAEARSDLARRLRQHRGLERLEITPAFDALMQAAFEFALARPDEAAPALERMFGVADHHRSIGRPDLGAAILARLEGLADQHPELLAGPPDDSSLASRAALARADALAEHARRLLSQRGHGEAQSAPIVAAFDAVLQAYARVHEQHAARPEGPPALERALALSLDWAGVGAWSRADAVFADFLGRQDRTPLRRPDRLEFARALCALGPVMPAHAQEVLRLLLNQQQTELAQLRQLASDGEMDPALGLSQPRPAGEALELEEMMAEADEELAAAGGFLLGRATGGAGPTGPGAAPAGNPGGPGTPGPGAPSGPALRRSAPAPTQRALMMAAAQRDLSVLAALRQHHSELATRIAARADHEVQKLTVETQGAQTLDAGRSLSAAELRRRTEAFERAWQLLQAVRDGATNETTAEQARAEMLIIARHWSELGEWKRAAETFARFLEGNPEDGETPELRWEKAQCLVRWAAGSVRPGLSKQVALERVSTRFAAARAELESYARDFGDDPSRAQLARWEIAQTFLNEARVVAGIGPTLARGRYARAVQGFLETARQHPQLPQAANVPQTVWEVTNEIYGRGFHDEAIAAWSELALSHPLHPYADQASLMVAQTYHTVLGQPLRAAEAYLELNFSRGGADPGVQQTLFDIACGLEAQKRWVESLHVLETFVDSFPSHPRAGEALAKIGRIHEVNEAWKDAILAYQRVVDEAAGDWAREAAWSIAQCTINLSRWREAIDTYDRWAREHAGDGRVQEAQRRIAILKDLARYQTLVDEDGQRKAFDAQFQIGRIVYEQLQNPVKAIVEYSKVATQWPQSHLADDALFTAGRIEFERGEKVRARRLLGRLASTYPSSPMADDALLLIGQSYVDEAEELSGVSRGQAMADSNDVAQREAYRVSQANRTGRRGVGKKRLDELRAEGKDESAELEIAKQANLNIAFDTANAEVLGNWASQYVELLSAAKLADRQDRINASLRKAVDSFRKAAAVPSGDKADEALLKMARIQEEQLGDAEAAMQTWLVIVEQYAGTSVAEDASWKIAQAFVQREEHEKAIDAYSSFLRNYRRSPKAGEAQYAIAENYEQLGRWVEAMDAYTKYLDSHPDGPLALRAQEQITWIKTYRL